jgi:hypothetical protein
VLITTIDHVVWIAGEDDKRPRRLPDCKESTKKTAMTRFVVAQSNEKKTMPRSVAQDGIMNLRKLIRPSGGMVVRFTLPVPPLQAGSPPVIALWKTQKTRGSRCEGGSFNKK